MKTSVFLLMLLFSLSCYSQKNIDVSFSISKEKETLFIHIENKSDSVITIINHRVLHRVEGYEGSRVYISDKKKEWYSASDEMYLPINSSEKGQKWYYKKPLSDRLDPGQKKVMDITGIREGLLDKDSLYVRLILKVVYLFNNDKKNIKTSLIISEQWVPVE